MSTMEAQVATRTMPFAVRPFEERDIAQSVEIEREAFPNLFPPTSFHRELKNRKARYLSAWRADGVAPGDSDPSEITSSMPSQNGNALMSRLLRSARGLWSRPSAWEPGQQLVAGFVGAWYMVDEAHIVSVGVRRRFRGMGVGELLLIGAIEQAVERRANVVTLEVRVSNHVARNLYAKYGLNERGVRKGYYSDNREDAVIMTTDAIHTPSYSERFRTLVRAHEHRWGRADRVLF